MMNQNEVKMFLDGWTNHNDEPLLFLNKLKDLNLDDVWIAKILKVIDETCNECWDDDAPCYCMRDD